MPSAWTQDTRVRTAGWLRSGGRALVYTASALATAGALHAAWNARTLPHLRNRPCPTDEPVSVLVPARDEEGNIEQCLAALSAQKGVPDLEILVGDDSSGDRTAQLVTSASQRDPRVRLISITAPGPGWLGKPNACQQLSHQASGTVLAFVDADVRLQPPAIGQAVSRLRSGPADTGYGLVSAWPRQQSDSTLGRLVQPLQQWSWLTTLPLRIAEASKRPGLSAANGQFLVCDTGAYRRVGGHASVNGAVLDDLSLARAFKRAGCRLSLVDAADVAVCRMYAGDRELVSGYAKSLATAFGGPRRGLAVAAALAAVYVTPVVAIVVSGQRGTRLAAAIGFAGGVTGRVVSARATGTAPWPAALTHPAGIAAFSGLMVTSVIRRRRGTLSWRGRPVPGAGTTTT